MSSPIRILIVEDSEDDALLLIRQIRRSGYEPDAHRVDNAGDLSAAMECQEWDIVISDHNMPSFDSEKAIEIVRSYNRDIPIIIVSGSIGEELAVQAMRTGANDYIMKNNLMRLAPAIDREIREAQSRKARRDAEQTIQHMAYHDALTGLANRHEFEKRLKHILSQLKDI